MPCGAGDAGLEFDPLTGVPGIEVVQRQGVLPAVGGHGGHLPVAGVSDQRLGLGAGRVAVDHRPQQIGAAAGGDAVGGRRDRHGQLAALEVGHRIRVVISKVRGPLHRGRLHPAGDGHHIAHAVRAVGVIAGPLGHEIEGDALPGVGLQIDAGRVTALPAGGHIGQLRRSIAQGCDELIPAAPRLVGQGRPGDIVLQLVRVGVRHHRLPRPLQPLADGVLFAGRQADLVPAAYAGHGQDHAGILPIIGVDRKAAVRRIGVIIRRRDPDLAPVAQNAHEPDGVPRTVVQVRPLVPGEGVGKGTIRADLLHSLPQHRGGEGGKLRNICRFYIPVKQIFVTQHIAVIGLVVGHRAIGSILAIRHGFVVVQRSISIRIHRPQARGRVPGPQAQVPRLENLFRQVTEVDGHSMVRRDQHVFIGENRFLRPHITQKFDPVNGRCVDRAIRRL